MVEHRALRWFLMSLLTVLVAVEAAASDYAAPGPFPAGWRTVTVTRPDGTTFTARVSYPAQVAGQNAAFSPGASSCPGITFGHGFLQPVGRYASTLDHLASWGFVVIASESGGELFPNHANFAADLRHCLTHLEQQNAAPGSFLFGRIDTAAFGAGGHSMGGGAAILGAAADVRIRAVATLAAADTSPSSIAAISGVSAPINLICGTSDTIVPPASSGVPMYAGARPPRLYNLINGGFHCGFEDVTSFGCDTSASMTRATQLAITRRLLAAFFMLHLEGDQAARSQVWGPGSIGDPLVACTRDPGVAVTLAGASFAARAGSLFDLPVRITNTSPGPESFEILVEGAWPGETVPVDLLPAGASLDVAVRISMPAAPGTATLLVTARRSDDRAARDYAGVLGSALCAADINLDTFVDGIDYDSFVIEFLGGTPASDLNSDGFSDAIDYDLFIRAFLAGC